MNDETLQDCQGQVEIPLYPVQLVDEQTILVTNTDGTEDIPIPLHHKASTDNADLSLETDEFGQYIPVIIEDDLAPAFLPEGEKVTPGHHAEYRVYIVSKAIKRTVVVKDDDLLSRKEIQAHTREIADATKEELRIWLTNDCFEILPLTKAQNLMTSRYVVKWK